jgi:hypothetical protein
MSIIAYNLIRALMQKASVEAGTPVWHISFNTGRNSSYLINTLANRDPFNQQLQQTMLMLLGGLLDPEAISEVLPAVVRGMAKLPPDELRNTL